MVPASRHPAALAALMLAGLLAGCGGEASSGPVRSASAAETVRKPSLSSVRPPVRGPAPAARVQALPGLEGVIGATSTELTRVFGAPRLDVWEGDARKLQFEGQSCVLDVFLYPSAPSREPQATYLDARRASDGLDVDRAACVSALRKRGR